MLFDKIKMLHNVSISLVVIGLLLLTVGVVWLSVLISRSSRSKSTTSLTSLIEEDDAVE